MRQIGGKNVHRHIYQDGARRVKELGGRIVQRAPVTGADREGDWLSGHGPASDIVVSSRVRLARNIAGSARRLAERPPVPLPPELHALADDSRNLMRLAIHAFCELDARAARDVLEKDDLIDELEDLLVRESIRRLSTTPEHTEQELDVIFIAQHLERIGDHATNIAEEVILAAEALNLKHFSKLSH